jgi:hypothetical protein
MIALKCKLFYISRVWFLCCMSPSFCLKVVKINVLTRVLCRLMYPTSSIDRRCVPQQPLSYTIVHCRQDEHLTARGVLYVRMVPALTAVS